MKTVDIKEVKAHLTRLVNAAAKGNSFQISEDGKPSIKVEAFPQRLDFLKGKFIAPDDFDRTFDDEIEQMFGLRD